MSFSTFPCHSFNKSVTFGCAWGRGQDPQVKEFKREKKASKRNWEQISFSFFLFSLSSPFLHCPHMKIERFLRTLPAVELPGRKKKKFAESLSGTAPLPPLARYPAHPVPGPMATQKSSKSKQNLKGKLAVLTRSQK